MTDANELMNPQHFGSDLANIGIRIQINLEIIGIQIRDDFWLRFALCELSLVTAAVLRENGHSYRCEAFS